MVLTAARAVALAGALSARGSLGAGCGAVRCGLRGRARRGRERLVCDCRRGLRREWGCGEPLIGARADQGLAKRCSIALSMPAGVRCFVSMADL